MKRTQDYDDLDAELLALLEAEDEKPINAPPAKRREYSPVAAAAPDPPPPPPRWSIGDLSDLPPEALFRMLGFLSPEDLTAVAQTCGALHVLASDDLLWKRLYTARWKHQHPATCATHNNNNTYHWKALYMDTDRVELTAAGIGAPGPLKTMYEQMVTSKRSHRLGRQHRMDLLAPPRTTNDHTDEVATWRRAHGYDPTQRWDPVHGCSRTGGAPVEYVQLSSSTFVCAGCGWAHVCGEGCGERQIDSRSDLLVCPISGRCFDRLLTNREEEEAAETRGGEQQDEAGEWSNYGHLAGAYVMGYSCNTEAELQRVFGV